MVRINQNKLAREVTLMEAGDVNCSIAQIKEMMRCLWDIIVEDYGYDDIARLEIIKSSNGIRINAV